MLRFQKNAIFARFLAWLAVAIGLAAVLATIVTHLLTLDVYPAAWTDEAWYSDPGASLLKVGRFAQTLFSGVAGFEISNIAYGRIYLVGQALSFATLGVNIFAARLPSLICGAIT